MAVLTHCYTHLIEILFKPKFIVGWVYIVFFLFLAILPQSSEANEDIYSHVSSKGKTYYLFKKDVVLKNSNKTRTIYFFAKSPDNKKGVGLKEVPADREVSETKSGMLVLKKKSKTLR